MTEFYLLWPATEQQLLQTEIPAPGYHSTRTVPKTFASNPHPTPNNVSFIDQAKVKLCQGNKLITMKLCNIIFGTVSCVFTFLVVWLWIYKYLDITLEFSIQLNC